MLLSAIHETVGRYSVEVVGLVLSTECRKPEI